MLNNELRQELLELRERDQQMRQMIAQRYNHPDEVSQADQALWMQLDAAHTARIKAIIAEHGWPGESLVGADGAQAAWLLVQHADQDATFQRQALALLEAAVAAGEASASDAAYLTDRVLMNAGQPQRYGTQMHMLNGRVQPWPIEQPEAVDARRAAAGLEPLATYLAAHGYGLASENN